MDIERWLDRIDQTTQLFQDAFAGLHEVRHYHQAMEVNQLRIKQQNS